MRRPLLLTLAVIAQVATAQDPIAIHEVQGDGLTTDRLGEVVTVQGIVTWVLGTEGFYIQDNYFQGPGFNAPYDTSSGIFIADSVSGQNDLITVGDLVEATGIVVEEATETMIYNANVTVLTPSFDSQLSHFRGRACLLTRTPFNRFDKPERCEGMITHVINLHVVGQEEGDVRLSVLPLPHHFTQNNTPSASGFDAWKQRVLDATANHGLKVEMDCDLEAPEFITLNTTVYLDAFPMILRTSDDGLSLVGNLSWDELPSSAKEERKAAGDIRAAVVNVDGFGFPGNQSGTDSEALDQHIVAAIVKLQAEVIGLVGFNTTMGDCDTAAEEIAMSVNDMLGNEAYQVLNVEGATCNAILYDARAVRLAEGMVPLVLNDTVVEELSISSTHNFTDSPLFGEGVNTAPIAATFSRVGDGATFTAVVVSLAPRIGLQADGQDSHTALRVAGVEALLGWLDHTNLTNATAPVVIMGDFNAFLEEDPVAYILGDGFVSANEDPNAVVNFDGFTAAGSLDYIFYSCSAERFFPVEGKVWGETLKMIAYKEDNITAFRPVRNPVTFGFFLGEALPVSLFNQMNLDSEVTIEAVVTADFQYGDDDDTRNLGGFVVQEEMSDEDNDTTTSEGVFVNETEAGTVPDVMLGDLVRITGHRAPNGDFLAKRVSVLRAGYDKMLSMVTHVNMTDETRMYATNITNMLVSYPSATIKNMTGLGVTNRIHLQVGGTSLLAFSQQKLPNATSEYTDYYEAYFADTIAYDDGVDRLYAPVDYLDGFAPFNEATAPRIGDVAHDLQGVLMESRDGLVLRPHRDGLNKFTRTSPRPLNPRKVVGPLTVALVNAGNFSTTLKEYNDTTALGLKPTGAATEEEFERQLQKLVNTISALQSDIIGLNGIENEFVPSTNGTGCGTAIQLLADEVNDFLRKDMYEPLYPDESFVGEDVFANAMLYNKEKLKVNKSMVIGDCTLNVTDDRSLFTFPPVAATFTHKETGESVTVIVVQLEDRSDDYAEDVKFYPQGAFSQKRVEQVSALANFLEQDDLDLNTSNVIIMGDMQSYPFEAGVQTFIDMGFESAVPENVPTFTGLYGMGTLDYIMASTCSNIISIDSSVWSINSAEAPVLGHQHEDPAYFNWKSAVRSSARDPVAASFNFNADEFKISTVQGAGDTSPIVGWTVVVEGIVVGDFQNADKDEKRNLGGFFMQEEVGDEDDNAMTSEGIFVADKDVDVNIGDLVRVRGVVSEKSGKTELVQAEVIVLEAAHDVELQMVRPVQVDLLKAPNGVHSEFANLQPYEGMLVWFANDMYIASMERLTKENIVMMTAGGVPAAFTQENNPNVELHMKYVHDWASRTIMLDDGLNGYYNPVDNLDGFAPYSEATSPRVGDRAKMLTGVVDSQMGRTVVRSHMRGATEFMTSPRPMLKSFRAPIKVASVDAGYFFVTLAEENVTTAIGKSPMGATTDMEFERQLQKLVNTILNLDADIVALYKIENEFLANASVDSCGTAVQTLVDEVNAMMHSRVFEVVYPGGDFAGHSAIANALIYRKDRVTKAPGTFSTIVDDCELGGLDAYADMDLEKTPIFAESVAPVAATFMPIHSTDDDEVTVVAVDLVPREPGVDADDNDMLRARQVEALMAWVNATAHVKVVIAGNVNAYPMEKPVKYLNMHGFESAVPLGMSTSVVNGFKGMLNYILTRDARIVNADVWAINSLESPLLDYRMTAMRPESYYNGSSSIRSAAQDPIIAGLVVSNTIRVSRVQGMGMTSPLVGVMVTIEGIVTGDFQNGNLGGFYLQEERSDEDMSMMTSEGIFIAGVHDVEVNVGDLVRVTGYVREYMTETQLHNVSDVAVVEVEYDPSLSMISRPTLKLPSGHEYFESMEGMLISIPQTLTLSDQHRLGHGEVMLVAGKIPSAFSQLAKPNETHYKLYMDELATRSIVYADGANFNNGNDTKVTLDGFYPYSEESAPRLGDQVESLVGILEPKESWRVRSHKDGVNSFKTVARRPVAPKVKAPVTVATLSMNNYLLTLDLSGLEMGEEERQLYKLVNMVTELEADIFGLVEIENDFSNDTESNCSTAIQHLADMVNERYNREVYVPVYPGASLVGYDAISNAILYNKERVAIAPESTVAILTDEVAGSLDSISHNFTKSPVFSGFNASRPSIAATFVTMEGGALTVVVNHFKSREGAVDDCDDEDPNKDSSNGAGSWNHARILASAIVTEWVETAPTGVSAPSVLCGMFNSYYMEDPVQYLMDNGYRSVVPASAVSSFMHGVAGSLDYIFVPDTVQALGEHVWAINAPESDLLGYRNSMYFNPESAVRAATRDPIVTGLVLAEHVPISIIQGTDLESPYIGSMVSVQGVVTADFQDHDDDKMRNMGGFFMQEEVEDEDDNMMTSEGIFVLSNDMDVRVGDLVRVRGTVDELHGKTLLHRAEVMVVQAGFDVELVNVSVAQIKEPFTWRPYDGMLVSISNLTIASQEMLDTLGEVVLVAGERPVHFTEMYEPNTTKYTEYTMETYYRSVTYGSGAAARASPVDYLDGFAPYSEETALRNGDRISSLRGVLDMAIEPRVRPHMDGVNTFERVNHRPASSPDLGLPLKVVSLNAKHLNMPPMNNAMLSMNTSEILEFHKIQMEKFVAALDSLHADVYAFSSIENKFLNDDEGNFTSVLTFFAERLGMTAVYPGMSTVGNATMSVGLMYNQDRVAIPTASTPAVWEMDGQVAVAASFHLLQQEETVTVVVNMWADRFGMNYTYDGSESGSTARQAAAENVVSWVSANPTELELPSSHVVLCGDFNAHKMEESMLYLKEMGYVLLASDEYGHVDRYGMRHTLNRIAVSSSLAEEAKGALWAINADEAPALATPLYANLSSPVRSGAHDAVVAGLSLLRLEWCRRDADCSVFGDRNAQCNVAARRCTCSPGFNWRTTEAGTLYTCFPTSTAPRSIRMRFRLRWALAVFLSLTAEVIEVAVQILRRVLGSLVGRVLWREGSIIAIGVSDQPVASVLTLPNTLAADVAREMANSSLAEVFPGEPSVVLQVSTAECELPGAADTADLNGTCVVLSCEASFRLEDGSCVGTEEDTPAPVREQEQPDDDAISATGIAAIVVGAVLLAAIVALVAVALGCRGALAGNKINTNEPAHNPDEV